MGVSRRSLITGAVAGSAIAAIPAAELLTADAAAAASPPGDVVGKITVGYQGWFACIGDGAPINGWWHWSQNWGAAPSPSNNGTLRAWPDMRDYTHKYQTAYANLGNGDPATLFSSYDQQTVDAHFASMAANNIDTAALQRFNPTGGEGPTRDAVTARVRTSAETYGRKFYVMYDVTGWTTMQSEIKNDWTTKMSAYTASAAYARQNGKPVVGIWGFGFNDNNHPWDVATCLDVINWFKSQGCYVMGGVPREWRTGVGGSRAGYSGVYHAFNMISPWMVGAIGNIAGSDDAYTNLTVPDQADCAANGIDYQPCVLPGDVSARQRVHGDFMWRQFYNVCRAGVAGIYISMFDEFNEGNQICKTAENQSQIPTNAGLLGLDEDGTVCSSDYYLRLTGDGGRMLKGQLALTATRPTQPVAGGGDTVPPTVPTNLHVTAHTSSSISIAWTASTDNVGVTGYRIQQNGVVVGSVGGTTTSYTASGLNPSTTYSYAVAAFDAAGDISAYSAPVSQATDASSGGGTTNLALNRPTTESSHTQTYASGNAVDGNTGTYWESTNSAFPQWIQVDLGAATALGRLVLKLPPGWGARTQTLSILGSTDGSSFSTVVGSAGYTFDPGSSNVVTITLPAATARYVRLNVTANTGWPAGQLSEFEVYGTSGGGDVTPPSAPGNVTVTGHTSTSASLSWTAATDNVGVTGYQVRRAGTVVATVSGTTFTNTGLNPSTAYSYSVVATDAAGNLSVASNTVTVTTDAAPNTNLAAGKATAESSHTQTYASGNAVDGDANSYWESNNNAFPQWLQVDLGAATSVRRVVLKLPPSAAWGARTQTLSVQGSSDGASFSTIVGSAGYVFDPNTGNSVTIVFGPATARYVRLTITGNTGWPAGQISEFEIYAS
jgi:chitodextrinase